METSAEETSDCVLIVDGEKFNLHKTILAQCSPVFEKMFFGIMATSDEEIFVSDIEVEDFKQTIDFIYKKQLQFQSILNAWSLVYIASKYLITSLLDLCVDYIKENLSLSTLLLSYEHAELYNLEKLMKVCLRDIAMYTKGVFLTTYHIKPSTWCAILKETKSSIDIEELAEFALKWAIDESNFVNGDCNVENVWKILCDANLTQFLQFLIDKEKCFNDEELKLFKSLEYKILKTNYCDNPKQQNNLHYHIRPCYKIYKNFRLRDNDVLETTISVNAKVALFGIVVNTERQPCSVVDESYIGGFIIEIYKENCGKLSLLDKIIESFTSLKYDHMHYINFQRIVILEPFTNYIVAVRYKTPDKEKSFEVLCLYTGSIMRSSIVFSFSNEIFGSALRGLSFYPL